MQFWRTILSNVRYCAVLKINTLKGLPIIFMQVQGSSLFEQTAMILRHYRVWRQLLRTLASVSGGLRMFEALS